jgi:enoyl-CoA hydratase
MADLVLRVEKEEGVATLTLHRPEKMNALSRELRSAIATAFREIAADPGVRVAILTGAGRAFCAGLDLRELGVSGLGGGEAESAVTEGDMLEAMRGFPDPIIGAINGVAVTGGFELALACDLLVASSEARFADTHARVGIIPGWGLSQKLPRMIGIGRAKELAFTGNYLSAEQAERWGLVNRVVAPQDLLPVCKALAKDMLSCEPDVLRKYKKLIDEGYAETFRDGMRLEAQVNREHAKTLTPDALEARRRGVQARGREQTK